MIGVDRGQQQRVIDLCAGLVWLHDAGIVDEHVHIGVLGDQLVGGAVDAGRIADVQFDRRQTWIGLDHGIEMAAATARDDQLVAALVQCLGERAADAGASASDEDGVACENPASMALRAALA